MLGPLPPDTYLQPSLLFATSINLLTLAPDELDELDDEDELDELDELDDDEELDELDELEDFAAFALPERNTAIVFLPTLPSTVKSLRSCIARTAASVREPKYPSTELKYLSSLSIL